MANNAQTADERTNPFTSGTPKSLLPQPRVLVILGAAGDLPWCKLLPAVYNLNVDGLLPSNFAVVAFGAESNGNPDEWIRQRARDGIEHSSRQTLDQGHRADFSKAVFYVEGKFDDEKAYDALNARLDVVDQQFGIPGARVFERREQGRDRSISKYQAGTWGPRDTDRLIEADCRHWKAL